LGHFDSSITLEKRQAQQRDGRAGSLDEKHDKMSAMNIYFSCSITGGRQDEHAYRAMVDLLLSAGHEVPTAHLSDPDVLSQEAVVTAEEVYERDIAWVEGCDAVVAEVSTPSHGVGYEIAYALGLGKPVLCCFQEGRRISKMITGNSHPTLRKLSYQTIPELVEGVTVFLRSVTLSREQNHR
jgi:hypothetical protein